MKPDRFIFPLGKLISAAVILVAAVAVQATPVSFTFNSFTHSKTVSGSYDGGNLSDLYVGNINIAFKDTSGTSSANVVAFCMELSQGLNIGQSYNYTATTLTAAGLSDAQARLVSILYDQYYAGPTTQDWNSVNTGAFQLALWELTHDTDGSLWSDEGDFYIQSEGSNKQVSKIANEYLTDIYELASDANYEPYSQLVSLTNAESQDLIVMASMVPGYDGGTVVAVPFGVNPLPGMAIVGLFAWRRLKKRRA
ncbi:thioester domain-containing protein [Ruficoccus sp. ZRK36]|uniref:thioester domain-containing protein n=1 Tax=Ruficoccus sp. ZRK36 TaxID=2866311 RepID=UPI001C72CDB4|nr:thioester domain-containing protein [Ruficoccus sp. ZRK36]QYY37336.1 thioester domain-containing protein [Ruficoccus sp. ZRK36]